MTFPISLNVNLIMRTNLKLTSKTLCILVLLSILLSVSVRNVSAEDNLSDTFDTMLKNERDFNQQYVMIKLASKTREVKALENSDVNLWLRDFLREIYDTGYRQLFTTLLNQRKPPKEVGGLHDADNLEEKNQGFNDFTKRLRDSSISQACANDTARILLGLVSREKWVTPFVDSTGKPGPSITLMRLRFVGNYKQCRSSVAPGVSQTANRGFKGNYCDLGVSTKLHGYPLKIEFGACVPDTCSALDLYKLEQAVVEMANMTTMLTPMLPECHTDEREITTATIIAIVIVSIIIGLMVWSTLYDLLVVQKWRFWKLTEIEYNEPSLNQEVPIGKGIYHNQPTTGYEEVDSSASSEATPLISKANNNVNNDQSTLVKCLLAFSVYSNAKKVLNTSQPPGSLSAIHGIRFLSMCWVVLGHVFMTVATGSESDNVVQTMPGVIQRWTFDAISNAFPSVDTFFTLSGLLTSYLTIKEMHKKSWKINWPMFYFHRFWRLTPPYMLVILIALGFQRFLGSGALWSNVQPADKANCEDNWWTNLLYVNNVVNADKMCLGQSWYLANDMQFFVLSPLMLIPFYFHRLAGFASCMVFLLVSWITTAVLSADKLWPTTMVSLRLSPTGLDWFNKYYIVPWCRIGPFVVGIMAGYLLAVTNGAKHLTMRWWMSLTGWLLAIVCGLAVVYGLNGDISGDHVSSVGAAAMYNAVSRSMWGACVCWVIIACAAGYGGPVNALLSWSPFVVLGRFTYMTYLIHLNMVGAYFQNADSQFHYTDTTMVITYVGLLVIVNMTAFVFMLGLESPMIGLEKALLGKRRQD